MSFIVNWLRSSRESSPTTSSLEDEDDCRGSDQQSNSISRSESLRLDGSRSRSASISESSRRMQSQRERRETARLRAEGHSRRRLRAIIGKPRCDLVALRKVCWNGVPEDLRFQVWPLLLGYAPRDKDRRERGMQQRRSDYALLVKRYWQSAVRDDANMALTRTQRSCMRQIDVDVPRTVPLYEGFRLRRLQEALRRVLFIYALRHPATSYVQGINDVATPLFVCFLRRFVRDPLDLSQVARRFGDESEKDRYCTDLVDETAGDNVTGNDDQNVNSGNGKDDGTDVEQFSEKKHTDDSRSDQTRTESESNSASQSVDSELDADMALAVVEADVFCCLGKLLDVIQDHYTHQQPGIQRQIARLGELLPRVDQALHEHLQESSVVLLQFAFRWMNCLLIRELPLPCMLRLWDAYFSLGADLGAAFREFHVFVCAALLVQFGEHLRTLPFQDIILFLQRMPPLLHWDTRQVEELLSQAFLYQALFGGAASSVPDSPTFR
ncbi:MAG: hypothetical protein MHM6MM_003732 [Cercozoa sp. M6MM]